MCIYMFIIYNLARSIDIYRYAIYASFSTCCHVESAVMFVQLGNAETILRQCSLAVFMFTTSTAGSHYVFISVHVRVSYCVFRRSLREMFFALCSLSVASLFETR